MKKTVNKGLAFANLRVIKTNNNRKLDDNVVYDMYEKLIDRNILLARLGIAVYLGIIYVSLNWL